MPPKLSPEVEHLAAFFAQCGLSEQRSLETARSKTAPQAHRLFQLAQADSSTESTTRLDDKQITLTLQLSKDGQALTDDRRLFVLDAIRDRRLAKADQVAAAIKYLAAHPEQPVDTASFNEACGVGASPLFLSLPCLNLPLQLPD